MFCVSFGVSSCSNCLAKWWVLGSKDFPFLNRLLVSSLCSNGSPDGCLWTRLVWWCTSDDLPKLSLSTKPATVVDGGSCCVLHGKLLGSGSLLKPGWFLLLVAALLAALLLNQGWFLLLVAMLLAVLSAMLFALLLKSRPKALSSSEIGWSWFVALLAALLAALLLDLNKMQTPNSWQMLLAALSAVLLALLLKSRPEARFSSEIGWS